MIWREKERKTEKENMRSFEAALISSFWVTSVTTAAKRGGEKRKAISMFCWFQGRPDLSTCFESFSSRSRWLPLERKHSLEGVLLGREQISRKSALSGPLLAFCGSLALKPAWGYVPEPPARLLAFLVSALLLVRRGIVLVNGNHLSASGTRPNYLQPPCGRRSLMSRSGLETSSETSNIGPPNPPEFSISIFLSAPPPSN